MPQISKEESYNCKQVDKKYSMEYCKLFLTAMFENPIVLYDFFWKFESNKSACKERTASLHWLGFV